MTGGAAISGRRNRRLAALLFTGVLFLSTSFSTDINLDNFDEAMLFQEETVIKPPTQTNNSNFSTNYNDQKSVNFTGQLKGTGYYVVNRNYLFGKGQFSNNSLVTYSDADLFLDVRLKKGIKAFINFGIINYATTTASVTYVADVKEFFLDFNLDQKIYFRAGKQYIKWGRTYFWNPVDVINTDQKNFLSLDAIHSGTYGLRVYFPFGAEKNLYFFLKTAAANNIDDVSLAMKYDFILGSSEIGLSVWHKNNYNTVYGLDFSAAHFGWDFLGEVAISNGSNTNMVVQSGNNYTLEKKANQLIPKISLNMAKSFNWERPNRISFSYEIFYNGDGYSKNILKNSTQKGLLLANDLYSANNLSSIYHASFVSISQFPDHSSTLQLNLIQNLIDYSGIFSTGITHVITDGFSVSGTVAAYFGPDYGEYLLLGNALQIQISSILVF